MAANYDRTAWFYDRLSHLVFGKSQVNAQNHFLHLIKPNSRILIVGGGTGQILEALTQHYSSGLDITYVEISAKMMLLSRKRNIGGNRVSFVTDDIGNVKNAISYDVIITAFLFDNFTDEALRKTFGQLHNQLQPNGLWLNTDFELTGPFWQRLMLKTMYRFFKLLQAVEVNKLPQTDAVFKQYQYSLTAQQHFYGKFISAKAYTKI
ncbi:class I SAM-dependent methyltransferase [Mucilaginibacter sp. Bleaf8]|uniref:class I SAM-dependent methyltransferase n=1 Tax=Mucilaginibacter sp. Bleaf8 TaxID=2834430 RepID=UPI001BCEF0FE|nr:class I SAM-dependent methyltransferase [Mucilaginibacter sp. Bleaf8]MBS7566143.1 class I SAM-dependent methyltransferase [Mucilaginibacter sp. Bleaf8]